MYFNPTLIHVSTWRYQVLDQDYKPLERYILRLNLLYGSLRRQVRNYDERRESLSLENNDIVEFHRRQLQTIKEELEMAVDDGREALQMADKAKSILQDQLDRAEESKRWRIEFLLALVAAVLALSQLLDKNVTGSLIGWIFVLEPSEVNTSDAFWVQIGLILVILTLSSLIWLGVRRWRNRRRKPQKPTSPIVSGTNHPQTPEGEISPRDEEMDDKT